MNYQAISKVFSRNVVLEIAKKIDLIFLERLSHVIILPIK